MSESIKLHLINNLPGKIQLTCGMVEHELEPGQQKTIEVEDEDCMYLDQAVQEGRKCGSEACSCRE